MKTLQNQSYYICGCCKLALPLEAFYVNKKTGRPANYCKECRKSASRQRRKEEKYAWVNEARAPHPVITETEDPELRLKLIHSALATVAASIQRKKQRLQEAALEEL